MAFFSCPMSSPMPEASTCRTSNGCRICSTSFGARKRSTSGCTASCGKPSSGCCSPGRRTRWTCAWSPTFSESGRCRTPHWHARSIPSSPAHIEDVVNLVDRNLEQYTAVAPHGLVVFVPVGVRAVGGLVVRSQHGQRLRYVRHGGATADHRILPGRVAVDHDRGPGIANQIAVFRASLSNRDPQRAVTIHRHDSTQLRSAVLARGRKYRVSVRPQKLNQAVIVHACLLFSPG